MSDSSGAGSSERSSVIKMLGRIKPSIKLQFIKIEHYKSKSLKLEQLLMAHQLETITEHIKVIISK